MGEKNFVPWQLDIVDCRLRPTTKWCKSHLIHTREEI